MIYFEFRPRKYRERLSPESFELESPKTGNWKVGVCLILPDYGVNGWFMPLLRSQRAGMATTVFLLRKNSEKYHFRL